MLLGSFFVIALLTSSFIPLVEAKPIKFSEPVGPIILSCTLNHENLTCTVKSDTGERVGDVTMRKLFDDGTVCERDTSFKKTISVTTRNSDNCHDTALEGNNFNIFIKQIGTNPNANISVDISILADSIGYS